MASTTKEKKASKKYYDSNKNYRDKKIKKQIQTQKQNKDKTADYQKDYYHSSTEYRKYKKAYAKQYRKLEPIKSRARTDRKLTGRDNKK